MDEKLKMLLDYVTREEDRYYDLSHKEMERGNLPAMMCMTAQATAFQRVRYAIEDIANGMVD